MEKYQVDQRGDNNMQILPSGQVQITNNQTGEIRVVDPSQLSSFSPLLANQYYNAMAENRANAKANGGGSSDVLLPPSGQMQTMPTSTNQQAPDLSGLFQFATPGVQQNQSPLLLGGIQNSTNSAQSATMSAPKSKPKPKGPSITLTPVASPMYPQFNGLNKF